MKNTKLLSGLILLLLFTYCSKPGGRYSELADKADVKTMDSTAVAENEGFISSSAAAESGKDSTRKFIRTAELKFKVQNVLKSTYNIEDITVHEGGFVTYSNLNSEKTNSNTTAISADSTLETTHYTVSNTMTLRVPNVKLDTVLKQIAKNIDYLDYRTIRADDVALQLLANKMTQKRSEKHEERLSKAIDNQGKKLNETSNAEENLVNVQAQADNAKIANLSLADQIKFSTINLTIYQRETVKREVYANEKDISAYTPNFFVKFWDALKSGWNIIQAILLFFIQFWGIILLAVISYFIYRKIVIYNKKKNSNHLD